MDLRFSCASLKKAECNGHLGPAGSRSGIESSPFFMAIWKKKAKVIQSLHWARLLTYGTRYFFRIEPHEVVSHPPRNEQELYCPRHGPILNSCHMHIASNSFIFWQAPTLATQQEHHQPFIFFQPFHPMFYLHLQLSLHLVGKDIRGIPLNGWIRGRFDHPQMAFNKQSSCDVFCIIYVICRN